MRGREQEIGLDAPLRLPKRETPDCGKYAITYVKVWQLKEKRREQLGFSHSILGASDSQSFAPRSQ